LKGGRQQRKNHVRCALDIYPALRRKIEETEIQASSTPGFLFLEHPGFGGKQTGKDFSSLAGALESLGIP